MQDKSQKRNYSKWTEEQQQVLQDEVQRYITRGCTISWINIAKLIEGKTPRQCYDQNLLLKKNHGQNKFQETSNNIDNTDNNPTIRTLDSTLFYTNDQQKQLMSKLFVLLNSQIE
ncbi:Conserved_hypothetical protein [Hexamita inflata]|uniref:Myb-like domain-containing protein n=1 Tax=Hexamita inflata TaxID=28002 RepID=A0AA86Q3F9_9EUKA|nr:Conserved hypothetical protein [Hexamita inflata]